MHTTRRRLLRGLGLFAGAGALHGLLPRAARSQDDTAAVTRRLAADLERHALFGAKFSAGPGDLATAGWVAEGYGEQGVAMCALPAAPGARTGQAAR